MESTVGPNAICEQTERQNECLIEIEKQNWSRAKGQGEIWAIRHHEEAQEWRWNSHKYKANTKRKWRFQYERWTKKENQNLSAWEIWT